VSGQTASYRIMNREALHHISTIAASALVAALVMAGSGIARGDLGESGRLSHLTPHLAAEELSHLGAHRPGLPPAALLVPLGNGVDGVLKGVGLADEARLIDALVRAQLTQQVLRVAVARVSGPRMALIKLQAGNKQTGVFSLRELQQDVAKCLTAAFAGPLKLDHLDLWVVVPGTSLIGDEQENRPVFSVSVDRGDYERATALAEDAAEALAGLDAVRFSPLFMRYAEAATSDLPGSAYCEPDLAEQWQSLLAEAESPVASALRAVHEQVSVLFHGRRDVNQVALTIDDGPHPLITPLMLAILKEKSVKATFFVVGKKAEQYPRLLRMIVGDGHELGNHAYSNRRLDELSGAEAWAEVEACHRVVERISGQQMGYFRPPGGRCSPEGLRAVGALAYTTVFWTRNTGDWRKPAPEEIVCQALTNLTAGDILLMHEGDMCSVKALPAIIDGIRDLGLTPTTVGEIERNGGTVTDRPERLTKLLNSTWLGHE